MKTHCFLLILAGLFALTACKKNHDEQCKDAMVRWAGTPAADGLGWILRFDSTHFEIPANLPDRYMIDSLPVSVCYRPSDKTFPCMCAKPYHMIEIVSIKQR